MDKKNIDEKKDLEEIIPNGNYRRAYTRVDAILPLTYTIAREEDYRDALEHGIYSFNDKHLGEAQIEEIISKGDKGLELFLIKMMFEIDKKLDMVLKVINKGENESLIPKEPVDVTLSGSGLCFESKDSAVVGDILKLKIYLQSFPQTEILVFGEVIEVEELESEKGYKVAIKYLLINEEDREEIIHFTLKKQQEILRNSKSNK